MGDSTKTRRHDRNGPDNRDIGRPPPNHSSKPTSPEVYEDAPFPTAMVWPRVSVVVCSYNGARTIRDTLKGLSRLEYPTYEIIVVDDGSTDATASIVREFGFQLLSTEHRGLSNARNTGMQVAQGEIVAYIDDDAYPDPHWLTYLATTFLGTNHAGVGGPHLAPAKHGWVADDVSRAPSRPAHVPLSDHKAEHLPGCNMAFRKSTLQSIGGFDPRYRVAGDDVDVSWRLQQRGWTLGFHPAAVVWHHPHNSVRGYWNQQKEYGKAEVLLEEKWPRKYRERGHVTWTGQRNGSETPLPPVENRLLQRMPERYLLIGALTILAALSALWPPLLYSLPLLAVTMGISFLQMAWRTRAAALITRAPGHTIGFKDRLFSVLLHGIRPIARLYGRLTHGFARWRRRRHRRWTIPWPQTISLWSEARQDPLNRLQSLEAALYNEALWVKRGGVDDHWDLEVGGGLFGRVRALMTVDTDGADEQHVRFRVWPLWPAPSLALSLLFALLSVVAVLDQAYVPASILAGVSILAVCRMVQECAWAMSGVIKRIAPLETEKQR